jgi:hypothetical protein
MSSCSLKVDQKLRTFAEKKSTHFTLKKNNLIPWFALQMNIVLCDIFVDTALMYPMVFSNLTL